MQRLIIGLICVLLVSIPNAFGGDACARAGGEREAAIDLDAHAGKVVYLDFWASWCGPCQQSFPWMIGLQERLADRGLVILTVNVDRDRAKADKFLEKIEGELTVIYDPEGKIAAAYELEGMPSSFVYGRDGVLKSTHTGFHSEQATEVEAGLIRLLEEGEENDAQTP